LKPALNWIKANWFIVACLVVMLISLPVLLVLGSSKTEKLFADRSKLLADNFGELQRIQVNYNIPGIAPNSRELELNAVVSEQLIEAYRTMGQARLAEITQIAEAAEAFNKRSHTVLSTRLFPQPSIAVRDTEPRDFARAIAAAHRRLIDTRNAGAPPSPPDLADELRDYRSRELERLRTSSGEAQLSEEEALRLSRELTDYRIARYRERAGNLAFYAVPEEAFRGIRFTDPEGQLPPLPVTWDWQERYWVNTDILDAVVLANNPTAQAEVGVPGAVVKRVISIEIAPPPFALDSGSDPMGGRGFGGRDEPDFGGRDFGGRDAGGAAGGFGQPSVGPANPGDPNQVVRPDYTRSLTGRFTSPSTQNGVYDIRHVRLQAVVSAARLNQFIEALGKVNFMTVTGLELTQIDRLAHLSQGYWYGAEPVVLATFEIETIWLRSWRTQWMPQQVRRALGVPDTQNNPD